jgi:hypothetical protein
LREGRVECGYDHGSYGGYVFAGEEPRVQVTAVRKADPDLGVRVDLDIVTSDHIESEIL